MACITSNGNNWFGKTEMVQDTKKDNYFCCLRKTRDIYCEVRVCLNDV